MNSCCQHALWIFAALSWSAQTSAVTYTATLLHPLGFDYSQAVNVSGTQQVGDGDVLGGSHSRHALLWNGTAGSFVDLNPAGFSASLATGVSNNKQAGYGLTGNAAHALLWSGTAASVVDLHPVGFTDSLATDLSGSNQVGYGRGASSAQHALMWTGTATSVVDLHPPGFSESFAYATSGANQVGYGRSSVFLADRALLWSGTATSRVSLHPTGFDRSYAFDVWGNQQVGMGVGPGSFFDEPQALMWSGTAASVVQLNPSGFISSQAVGISAAGQVGFGFGSATGYGEHALYWSSTAASVVDLHPFLSGLSPAMSYSRALGISDDGTIVGVAFSDIDGQEGYAVLWSPVLNTTGDYNHDGTVDAADYVVWRKDPNSYGGAQGYTDWVSHFGQTAASGSSKSVNTIVPEPGSVLLMTLGAAFGIGRRNRADQFVDDALT
jgi:uncharacterized membrane protein